MEEREEESQIKGERGEGGKVKQREKGGKRLRERTVTRKGN